jgi:cephalosporin hydroxylase
MLKELFNKYGCDKAKKHHYHTVYQPEFEPLQNKPINILEVGVFKGESASAWIDFFPNATVYGLDIFVRVSAEDIPILQHPRVKWLKGDSTHPSVSGAIQKAWPDVQFDIIIDDGLHRPEANALTFINLFPFIKSTGSYYVEDVWPLDIANQEELQHWWLQKNPEIYNMLKMNIFLNQIQNEKVERFDLRKLSGHGDSYIIKVQP